MKQSLRKDFYLILKRKREAERLTQTTLAARCGVSQTTVARVEQGDLGLEVKTLLAICNALGVRVTEVLAGLT